MTSQNEVRLAGTLSDWKDRQGFGFITPEAGGDRIFVHRTAFTNRKRQPAVGAKLLYSLAPHKSRRVCASQVSFVMDTAQARAADARQGSASWSVVLFLSLLAVITFKGYLPVAVLGLYLVASAISFLAYSEDKSAARAGHWRTSEKILHLLDVLCGWPGGLLAQKKLRHKCAKRDFQVVFWLTVFTNCAGLAWLLSPGGKALLRHFF
ncbi:MAG: DNA-binding protein [Rhodocyclales bacterium]|nr:DNA-binding protein [Rhodocyclales bacterium]